MSTSSSTPSPARKRKKTWVPVVVGILNRGNKVLLGQRPADEHFAGLWEFPGGKIEVGESPEAALTRELREELGIEAQVGDLLLSCTHSYGETNLLILFFEVKYWKGELKTQHHLKLEWVETRHLKTWELPEANLKMLGRLLPILTERDQE